MLFTGALPLPLAGELYGLEEGEVLEAANLVGRVLFFRKAW